MSTPESKVKNFVDNKMKLWYPNAVKYSPPGVGRFGKNGMPDRLWWIWAAHDVCVPVAIEIKAEGNEATALQIRALTKLQDQGVVAAIVTGKNEKLMIRIKNEIDRRIRKAQNALC